MFLPQFRPRNAELHWAIECHELYKWGYSSIPLKFLDVAGRGQ